MEAKAALSMIKEQVEGQKADEVEEITITEIKNLKTIPDQVKTKLESFKKLMMLLINNCDLENLDNLPKLPELIRLDVSENKLKGSNLDAVAIYGKLEMLSIGANNISTLDELEPLKKLPNLKELELTDCPITESEGYRKGIFTLLPNLEVIDREDKEGNPVEDDEDEFPEGDDDEDDDEEDDDDEDEEDEDDDDEEYEEEEEDEEYEEKGRKKLKK